jgi:uncharacterized protein YdeI (YjbR/CyaY-like superfamily)
VKPIYFSSPAEFRKWLEKNHAKESELLAGYHKKGSGVPSMTWPESVDEALCFGWIDGVRRSVDESRYTIRFTPRRPKSNWSAVNIKRVAELKELGRMKPAGLKAFEERVAKRDYAYETKPQELAPEYVKRFPKKAWAFFEAQPPYYRRVISFWVMSAKKEETRQSRLEKLIAACIERKRVL